MVHPHGVVLTGATGLLGRYLLRDLLAAGRRVSVLVRDGRPAPAAERVAAVTAWASQSLGQALPAPVVLAGELTAPHLGLSAADRRWLAKTHTAVLHAAASLVFRGTPAGEPGATNVEGTGRLLDLARSLGFTELHHVSTAFVCGDRRGTIGEDELDCGQGFHNDYERSKCAAERLVRQAAGLRTTIYRPSVIVGDSRTGYTSTYQGLYRFIELAARLAATSNQGTRSLPVRLPFTGDEPRDLVPVDWVSRAIIHLVARPACHGRTYHLTAREPVPVQRIKEVAGQILRVVGAEWAGPDGPADPTSLERLLLDRLHDYLPYRHGDPAFDRRHTAAALPDLPPPPVDDALLARLIRFAEADRWGRGRAPAPKAAAGLDCRRYIEDFFPEHAPRSALARLIALDLLVGFEITGPGGGRWSCRWVKGELAGVHRGLEPGAAVVYRTDPATLADVVQGRLDPREAFFARRIEVAGDLEKALKLAVLFGQFVREFPYRPSPVSEAPDVAPLSA